MPRQRPISTRENPAFKAIATNARRSARIGREGLVIVEGAILRASQKRQSNNLMVS